MGSPTAFPAAKETDFSEDSLTQIQTEMGEGEIVAVSIPYDQHGPGR